MGFFFGQMKIINYSGNLIWQRIYFKWCCSYALLWQVLKLQLLKVDKEYIYGKCQTATRIIKWIPLGVELNIKTVAQIT